MAGEVEFSPEEAVDNPGAKTGPGSDDAGASCNVAKSTYKFDYTIAGAPNGRRDTFACSMWRPESKPKAMVFLCHGFAEYLSDQWDVVGNYMARRGLLAFGHDHLGHGHTTGERVQAVVGFEPDYVGPVLAHCRARKAKEDGMPLFIVGHSMGGLITLLSAHRVSGDGLISGVVLNGPMIEVDPDIATPVNVFLAKWLSAVWPSKQLAGVNVDDITSDEAWLAKIRADELRWGGGIKVKHGYSSMKILEEWDKECVDAFSVPMLVQHGSLDKICPPAGSERLQARAKSEDKTLKMYEGAKHNLYIEAGDVPAKALGDAYEWIEKRI